HHGQRTLVPDDSPLCTACHTKIDKLLPETHQPPVGDLAHHPEFTVRIGAGQRVALDSEQALDTSVLKFSHVEHLGAVQKKDGTAETLSCASCHQRPEGGKQMVPISFERHCERCHALSFDPRIKSTRVPHGDPEAAIGVVRAALAEFNLNANEGSRE